MSTAIESHEVRAELRRILNSPHFEVSDRNRRFLAYTVEETLAGRGDRLKAYTIATAVFGRPDTFDMQNDPVVRMEARRVRRGLERFYLMEGDGEAAVRITMPTGRYVAVFQRLDRSAAGGCGRAASAHARPQPAEAPTFVLPFNVSGESGQPGLGRRLARRVMIALHQLGQSVASGFDAAKVSKPSKSMGTEADGTTRRPARELTGDLAIWGDNLSVTALLIDGSTRKVQWGGRFQRGVMGGGITDAIDEVAAAVAHELHAFLSRTSPLASRTADETQAAAASTRRHPPYDEADFING